MATIWQKRYENQFSSSNDLTKETGNGLVSLNSGNLEFDGNGEFIRWDSVVQNPNVSFLEISSIQDAPDNAYMLLTRVVTDEAFPLYELFHGMFLYQDDLQTAWMTAVNRNSTGSVETRFKNGSGQNFAGGGTSGGLGNVPVWLKTYWNVSGDSVLTQEGDSLADGDLISYYSTDSTDGQDGNWFSVHTQSIPSTPDRAGIGQWAGPSSTSIAKFDVLEFWEFLEESGFVAVQSSDTTVLLTFDSDLELTGAAGAAAADPVSYSIDSLGLGVDLSVSTVQILSATQVRLTVNLATNGTDYQVNIDGALEFDGGPSIQGETAQYTAAVSLPVVTSIVPRSSTTLRVTFSRNMKKNADLFNLSKYVFTGGISATKVTRVSPTVVDVETTEQNQNQQYSITVNP